MNGQTRLYASLIIATFAVAWASIFIKLSGAEPIPAAFYRMAIASVILFPFALKKNGIKAHKLLNVKERYLLVLSGIVLGLHFAVWVTSLFYTTISNSVIMVATQPIWVMIIEALFFKTKVRWPALAGTFVALIGMVVISQAGFSLGADHLYGNLLALTGAIFAAIYLIIGRRLRTKLSNINYTFPVYLIAAIVLLIIGLSNGDNMIRFSTTGWLMFILLAIIPTLTGHSLYNWLLKYVSAHKVSMTILGEPIGATILAIFFFNEFPTVRAIAGGVMILFGIIIVLGVKQEKMDK